MSHGDPFSTPVETNSDEGLGRVHPLVLPDDWYLVFAERGEVEIPWGSERINPYVFWPTFIPGANPIWETEYEEYAKLFSIQHNARYTQEARERFNSLDSADGVELRKLGLIVPDWHPEDTPFINAFTILDQDRRNGYLFDLRGKEVRLLEKVGIAYHHLESSNSAADLPEDYRIY